MMRINVEFQTDLKTNALWQPNYMSRARDNYAKILHFPNKTLTPKNFFAIHNQKKKLRKNGAFSFIMEHIRPRGLSTLTKYSRKQKFAHYFVEMGG
jgi:hypothetical protein